jgi:hypothetical protein
MNDNQQPRIVTAPQIGATDSSAQVLSVTLLPDEEVIWHWTHYPDGRSAVTGYEIIKKTEPHERSTH